MILRVVRASAFRVGFLKNLFREGFGEKPLPIIFRDSECVFAHVGGNWNNDANAGLFNWNLNNSSGDTNINISSQTLINELLLHLHSVFHSSC